MTGLSIYLGAFPACEGRTSSSNMADTGELLFAGRLLSVVGGGEEPHLQIKKEAIAFLQRLAGPMVVVSIHGAKVRRSLR